MRFDLSKYKFAFFKDGNGKTTISARSTYAGKTVKGYAKCDPRDSYNVEFGKALAAARCNAKIAEKRVARAQRQVAKAARMVKDAQAYEAKMNAYLSDSIIEADNAESHVADLLKEM